MSLAYRPAIARDVPMIVANWVDSFRDADAAGMINVEDWRPIMEPQVRKVLARPGVECWVAYHPDETDPRADLHGWICVERGFRELVKERFNGRWEKRLVPSEAPLIHYTYVLHSRRRCGIARGLFLAAGIDPNQRFLYTCRTPVVSKLHAKIPFAHWDPKIARHTKNNPKETP